MDTHSTLSNVIIVAVGYLIIIVLWPKLCKVKGVYEPPDIPPPLKLHPHIPSTPLQPIKPPPLIPLQPSRQGIPGNPAEVQWRYENP